MAESWFAKTENRLYAYPALIAKYRLAIAEYYLATPALKVKTPTATSFIRGGDIDSQAERWVLSREKAAQGILFLEERVQTEINAVAALWEILTQDEKRLAVARYFEQQPRYMLIDHMCCSRQTCDRIRRRAVQKAAYIYGYLDYEEYTRIVKQPDK